MIGYLLLELSELLQCRLQRRVCVGSTAGLGGEQIGVASGAAIDAGLREEGLGGVGL